MMDLRPRERADFAAMALVVAEEAAALLLGGYRSRPRVDKKGRTDLVTELDRRSEALIVSRLGSLSPEIPIVAEEGSPGEDRETPEPATAMAAQSGRPGLVWYVDPLDGTTNYVHGHPFYCVAVGLMLDDEPIAGAVVAPSIGVRWSGWVEMAEAEGALPIRATQGSAERSGERCRVSATTALSESLIATGFPPNRHRAPENNFDSFISVKKAARGVRRCGSAAMDLCLVADGTYDAYWERRLHSWDIVAASAIVLAAGGRITALDGGFPDYHVGHLVASNGHVHDELIAAIHR
jgi:myo-inositol-1(or 4)-monophosphatase